ncbi:MAG TPA: DeoR/GlpR transcriptional regulator [Trueperaceae bacterium]|nr:DeoR/GlpR transcriptional regulator [Trueperaceae bacterium]
MYDLKTYKNRHRQGEIHNYILHLGFVKIADIAEQFAISLATVRRDLDALERRALIERTWGGAKVRSPIRYLADFEKVALKQIKAKRAIAAKANEFVKDGMIIGLSGGTTCTEFARWLRGRSITVVTNAINVATELYNHSHTKVIVTGGHLNSYSYELVGDLVDETLAQYKLDISFLGVTGIEQEFGFSMRDSLEASIARAFLCASDKAIVIADHTKIGQKAMAEFAPFSEIEYLISDEAISPEQIAMLDKAGLKLSIAPGLQS